MGKLIQLPKTVLNIFVCALAARGNRREYFSNEFTDKILFVNEFFCA